ncbi:MAG TPA: ATP-binding protein [Deltaproteobacteria bacterium]|nr:ATP-binding protein [Deltaproteobacteria bacterium]
MRSEDITNGRLDFSQHLLRHAAQDKPRIDFLSDVLMLILSHSGCHAVEIWLKEKEDTLRGEASTAKQGMGRFLIISDSNHDRMFEKVCAGALTGLLVPHPTCSTRYGSIWFDDTLKPLSRAARLADDQLPEDACIGGRYRSILLVPLRFSEEHSGLLLFKERGRGRFNVERIGYLETIAAKFELALLHQIAQARLRERVKELTCLYGIAQTASNPVLSFERKLEVIVSLLPPAWQYPDRACARITIDGAVFQTPGFKDGPYRQNAPICIGGRLRGTVEIHYRDERPFLQKNPFLDEEQSLIDNIAGQIAQMIDSRETEAVKSELRSQLIRADRLAAIGQLAAGVAHELNEPLNTILGFAQLAQKAQGIPEQTFKDIGKIAEASLHARNIIRELLVFARQAAPDRGRVNMNTIIMDELNLFEKLCSKSSVELRRITEKDLPEITADKSQILQVVSNLIVNALQAMPDGGVLTLETSYRSPWVCLMVEDTGIGMSEEVKENIFLPFFTTKDVNQGTGLGLSVVHGIVSSHGGEIRVESTEGKGSRFLVTFPSSEDTSEK